MTNNSSTPNGGSGHVPNPLDQHTFLTERAWDPVPELVFDRWMNLSDDDKRKRFDTAFAILFDENIELDRGTAQYESLASADAEMWWAATTTGRRTLGALERLDIALRYYRDDDALDVAWLILEVATGFFGVAVWLQRQDPFVTSPPTAWVQTLVARCGADTGTLIAEFVSDSNPMVLDRCVDAAMTEAWSLGCDDANVFTLHLFVAGEPVPDLADALDVVGAITHWVDAELPAALATADYGRAGRLIAVGAGALELAYRLGHGCGLADGERWEAQ